ncbi:MAG: hypothetical protein LBG99_01105 [Propionibacteriaceae bacterium]|jgi:hypothetical protein|nr:hypothetical protein [Propionibacteriaceae bacterium]
MDKTQLQALYLDYLRAEGYQGEVDSDGDIEFKYQGYTFFIDVDSDDEQFFKVFGLFGWEFDDQAEKTKAYQVANELTKEYKVGKLIIRDKGIAVATEIFTAKPEDFKTCFGRLMSILGGLAQEFSERMQQS